MVSTYLIERFHWCYSFLFNMFERGQFFSRYLRILRDIQYSIYTAHERVNAWLFLWAARRKMTDIDTWGWFIISEVMRALSSPLSATSFEDIITPQDIKKNFSRLRAKTTMRVEHTPKVIIWCSSSLYLPRGYARVIRLIMSSSAAFDFLGVASFD